MEEIEALIKERDYYNKKMKDVLDGGLHLKRKGEHIGVELSLIQKQKDLFLYKFYENGYNRLDKEIQRLIKM